MNNVKHLEHETMRHRGQTYHIFIERQKNGMINIVADLLSHRFRRSYLYYTEAEALKIFKRDAKSELNSSTYQRGVTQSTLTINNATS